jgi:hypothetical protein
MKFFYPLLGLIATATAVDIRFTNSPSCDGWYAACSNINPGICCSIAQSTRAIEFAAVPSTWFLRKTGYLAENCVGFLSEHITRGGYCDSNPRRYQSARYEFFNEKLARSPGTGDISEDCQRVDTFVLEDGTKYPISQLNDGEVTYLV